MLRLSGDTKGVGIPLMYKPRWQSRRHLKSLQHAQSPMMNSPSPLPSTPQQQEQQAASSLWPWLSQSKASEYLQLCVQSAVVVHRIRIGQTPHIHHTKKSCQFFCFFCHLHSNSAAMASAASSSKLPVTVAPGVCVVCETVCMCVCGLCLCLWTVVACVWVCACATAAGGHEC